MAPTRLASKPIGVGNENLNGIHRNGITTRSKQMACLKSHKDNLKVPNKRKANSPLKDVTAKRAAFGDITNALKKPTITSNKDAKVMPVKKVTVESKLLPSLKSVKPQPIVNGKPSKTKVLHRVATNALESVQKRFAKDPPKPVATRAQNGVQKVIERREKSIGKENENGQGSAKSGRSDVSGEPSLYVTALENISPSETTKEECKTISDKLNLVNLDDSVNKSLDDEVESPHKVPQGIADFDLENWNDPLQASQYAMDIFNYLKSRESKFRIDDYLERLPGITAWMRSLLVDWMVEVQESFELNHETLYLGVKLVDLYLVRSSRLQRTHMTKEELQLLGASSLFIASKFDERIPPLVDDFVYICDGAYTLSQILKMEMDILKTVDFDLGIPLSYRFLRRYARCARVSMPTLTLARYVLEQGLLHYGLLPAPDSRLAAAALYLALRMKGLGSWTPTLHFYTGYTLQDILPVALEQNAILHEKPKSTISTVRNKYSHTIFFEVAKVPLVDDSVLCS